MFAEIQHNFATALLDADRPVPNAVTAHTGRIDQRFAVYRNNVAVSLVAALTARFPALVRIVGEEFFTAMARVFVSEHPPRSPLLMTYGDDFADFIEQFPPAAELPYLSDVARLEAARTRAYHAADAEPADPRDLQALAPAALAQTRVTLHPSAEIVRSAYPIVTVWAMNSGEAELAPIADWTGEDALIVRPRLDVEVRKLPAGGAVFLLALKSGAPLQAAADAAIADDARFDLVVNLAGLLGSGLVTAIATPEPAQALP